MKEVDEQESKQSVGAGRSGFPESINRTGESLVRKLPLKEQITRAGGERGDTMAGAPTLKDGTETVLLQ